MFIFYTALTDLRVARILSRVQSTVLFSIWLELVLVLMLVAFHAGNLAELTIVLLSSLPIYIMLVVRNPLEYIHKLVLIYPIANLGHVALKSWAYSFIYAFHQLGLINGGYFIILIIIQRFHSVLR